MQEILGRRNWVRHSKLVQLSDSTAKKVLSLPKLSSRSENIATLRRAAASREL